VDDISTRLAANLKLLREEAGLSQKALAEQSGVPRPTIAHLESGQANPTLTVALKVATTLGVTMDGLVDPGEAPIVVLSPRSLPTTRTSRLRRVQVLKAGSLRDAEVERVTLKAAGRLHLDGSGGRPHYLICERGEFTLVSGSLSLPLTSEKVAHIRGACDCVTEEGGVLYVAWGR
jgi:transcriptional regulator with XRE-family HTH domain